MGSRGNIQITQIAEQLGLSPGTVSVVLNGRGDKLRISRKTQERVKEAARNVGYQPNIYARRLRSSGVEGTNCVIAVFWNLGYSDELMGSFFRGLKNYANDKSYGVEFYVHMFEYGQLSECEQIMTPTRFSGMIICGISDADAAFLDTHSFALPIVCTFRNDRKYHSVYTDDYQVGRRAAELFAKRGHRNVGFIESSMKGPNSVFRKQGFVSGCRELGLQLEGDWIQEEEGRDFASGYKAMGAILRQKARPTAVFVNVQEQAVGAVSACKAEGIAFGKNMELFSVGQRNAFSYFLPSISMACTPAVEAAEVSLELLLTVIQDGVETRMERALEAQYIFGDTCGEA